jgi:hemerythrin-like domain-containing protein
MKVYEPLAVEHGLILRLLNVVESEIKKIKLKNRIDTKNVDLITDFFVTYLDIAHHGKEENILFPALRKKTLSFEHKNMMTTLLDQHVLGRKLMRELIIASEEYRMGSSSQLPNITARLADFVVLYRKHISIEDDDYFVQCSKYLTQEEQDAIIRSFWLLDIKLVHEKYKNIISLMETGDYAL